MEQKRYFTSISLIRFQVDSVSVNYPDDVFKLYLTDYAPKYIKQIITKWQKGKLLTDRDYYLLIKKALGNPCKVRSLPEATDLMSVCGVEVKAGKWGILEEARQEVEQKALRFCLEQMLTPYTAPVLEGYFPGEHFNLGFWQEVVKQEKTELDFNIKMAYIFTLYNYQLDMESEARCGYFPDYYCNELKKRLAFIKVMLENRNPGEGLDYIPLFENFRNFSVEKGALMAQMISRILKSQNLGPGEKDVIEDALISHARAAANCRDEEATQLKDKLLNPMVSQVVSLNKSREFLQAASLCLEKGLYNSALNRCYYAMLRACRAALVKYGWCKPWKGNTLRPMESHEEVLANFQRILVDEKKVFPAKQAEVLRKTLQKRLIADYGDLEIKPGEAARIFKQAQNFVKEVEAVIDSREVTVL